MAYTDAAGGSASLLATDTVLATGGFANDRSDTSLLEKHRPDLLRFPTTNGPWATGDGMKMAMAIGAGTVDMDRVQVQPARLPRPAAPLDPSPTLACPPFACRCTRRASSTPPTSRRPRRSFAAR